MAKTYYICGVILNFLITLAKRKPNAKELLSALDRLSVDMLTAAKQGLPCRHVTIRSRGGLLFASRQYFELMNKIEDHFYSTVGCVLCIVRM